MSSYPNFFDIQQIWLCCWNQFLGQNTHINSFWYFRKIWICCCRCSAEKKNSCETYNQRITSMLLSSWILLREEALSRRHRQLESGAFLTDNLTLAQEIRLDAFTNVQSIGLCLMKCTAVYFLPLQSGMFGLQCRSQP